MATDTFPEIYFLYHQKLGVAVKEIVSCCGTDSYKVFRILLVTFIILINFCNVIWLHDNVPNSFYKLHAQQLPTAFGFIIKSVFDGNI